MDTWYPEADNLLVYMYNDGAPYSIIAKQLGVSINEAQERAATLTYFGDLLPREEVDEEEYLTVKAVLQIPADYRHGLALCQMSKKYGVSEQRVAQTVQKLREAGVTGMEPRGVKPHRVSLEEAIKSIVASEKAATEVQRQAKRSPDPAEKPLFRAKYAMRDTSKHTPELLYIRPAKRRLNYTCHRYTDAEYRFLVLRRTLVNPEPWKATVTAFNQTFNCGLSVHKVMSFYLRRSRRNHSHANQI